MIGRPEHDLGPRGWQHGQAGLWASELEKENRRRQKRGGRWLGFTFEVHKCRNTGDLR